jgi:Holliday junction resolvasome RuvABC DNA-binding subunit
VRRFILTYFASKWRFYQIVHSPTNKEDAHTLFGFIEKSEKRFFKLLLSVSGIGANIARTMLSSLDQNKSQMQLHQQMLSRYSQLKEWVKLKG